MQLTVITLDRKYTVSLNALGLAVKTDLLIEIKTCAWCRDQFVSAAAHQQFASRLVGRLHFVREVDDNALTLTGAGLRHHSPS